MHLNNLVIHNFKKYRRTEIVFQDGLTGIIGGNGTGKSTIVEAVAWALYGNRASTIKREFLKNANAREMEPVEVRLTMNLGKREITVYRAMLGKNLYPDASLSIDGSRVATGTKEVDRQLDEILGISFQDFMKTFYARQKDLDNLLREGGVGKRDYLLKLLGLDEIRERAMVRIKEDGRHLQDERNRLMGAIAEIGDVKGRIDEISSKIRETREEHERAGNLQSSAGQEAEQRQREKEIAEGRRHSHELIATEISRLKATLAETEEAARSEEVRIREMGAAHEELAALRPDLERLGYVRRTLEELEPRRQSFEELSRKGLKLKAETAGKGRVLGEREERLFQLRAQQEEASGLKAGEEEYRALSMDLAAMDRARDRYVEMRSRLAGARARNDDLTTGTGKVEAAIRDLEAARSRLEEIEPLAKRYEAAHEELARTLDQKALKLEVDRLCGMREAHRTRSEDLTQKLALVEEELTGLGDLEAAEEELRGQDLELDRLNSDLTKDLADLGGDRRVNEASHSEARRNLSRIEALGPESNCPTCERPLGEHRDGLIEKYRAAISDSGRALAELRTKEESLRSRIGGVIKARTRLKTAFDDLGARKGQRAELSAKRRGLEDRLDELAAEARQVEERIGELGPVSYDPGAHADLEAELEKLDTVVREKASIEARLEQLPAMKDDLVKIKAEAAAVFLEIGEIEGEMDGLGYHEADHSARRRRHDELEDLHQRFTTLRERGREIPQLEDSICDLRAKLEVLEAAAKEVDDEVEGLGFDPEEHEALAGEKRALYVKEERANQLRLKTAGEDEAKDRLHRALEKASVVKADLERREEDLSTLGYQETEHEAAKEALALARARAEEARRAFDDTNLRLNVQERERDRLMQEGRRKKEYEAKLAALGRGMEVVEATRNLVNRFMDHVLIRVKDDIARTAGGILEEVTGKYSLLQIDDSFNILVESDGAYYPITRFSGGEIDMIAVSVRVAISDYLMRFRQGSPGYSFMILDEVFGSQDVEHRENMINMLRRLEDRFPQIFAISHISEVQGQFDNTVTVIEDGMGNSTVKLGS